MTAFSEIYQSTKKVANPFVVPKTVNIGLTVEQLRKLLQYNSLYALLANDRL